MESGQLVDDLVAVGILDPVEAGEALEFTDDFASALADREASLEAVTDEERRSMIESTIEDQNTRTTLTAATDRDPGFIAMTLLLAEWGEDIPDDHLLSVAITLFQHRRTAPPDHGAPNYFLPIHGDTLGLVSSLFERCIAFIWRDNCPTCETVREDFDVLLEEGPPEDVTLLSIYGPDSAAYLQEEFDVVGGPTVLFLLNERVDVRLQGAHGRTVLENEIETIQQRSVEAH